LGVLGNGKSRSRRIGFQATEMLGSIWWNRDMSRSGTGVWAACDLDLDPAHAVRLAGKLIAAASARLTVRSMD
jgi:hypothetical protein